MARAEWKAAALFFCASVLTAADLDCAACHPSIAAGYAQTGMGRSFHSAPKLLTGQTGNYRIQGNTVHQVEPARDVSVDYVIGSGDGAASYLHRTRDNKLIELPVTWYSENGGHWGASPGYDRVTHPGFSRNLAYRCLFCHNGYPTLEPGNGATEGESIFPEALPEGIDCRRCHGSGPNPINPANLSPRRQLEVCLQCHLETTSLAPWASKANPARSVFSYEPGQPLGDYITWFDKAAFDREKHDEKLELVSQAYRFLQSTCFLKSNGKLTCTNCHNPHEAAKATDAVCGQCHQAHESTGKCIACHMPRRQASDAIHIAVTDHLIARRPAPQSMLIEQHDGNTPVYTGRIVPFYPSDFKELATPSAEDLYRAGRFDEALQIEPGNWRYLYGAGRAHQDAALLERALALAPWETAILQALGAAYFVGNRPVDAERVFKEATERDPEDASAFSNLGNVLLRAGDRAGAERAFREAIRLRPELPQLRENLRNIR